MTTMNGDLHLAAEYLEKVATSNASDVQDAVDMLKKVKVALQARADEIFAATSNPPTIADD